MTTGSRRYCLSVLLALAAFVGCGTYTGPSHAGNEFGADALRNFEEARRDREEYRRQREEARRERDEQRAARDEARRQREAEHASREEAKRQRDEQRAQQHAAREEARREREAEKAARQESRRQREEEREAEKAARQESRRQREEERAAREASRQENASDSDQADTRSDLARGNTADRPNSPTPWRADVEKGSSSGSERQTASRGGGEKQAERQRGSGRNGERRETARRERENSEKSQSAEGSSKGSGSNSSGTGNAAGKTSSSDDEDETDDGEVASGDAEAPEAVVPEVVEVEPPRTLSELFKQWSEPATAKPPQGTQIISGVGQGYKTKSEAKPVAADKAEEKKTAAVGNGSGKTSAASKAATTGKQAQSSQTAGDDARPRGVDWELLSMGSFRRHEIIASGVDDRAAERLGALGFSTISQVRAPGAPTSVRRLKVPAKMSEKQAQAVLEQEIPGAQFGPNHVYKIVPAGDEKTSSMARAAPGQDFAPCDKDHCFPRRLLSWQDTLNSCASRVRIGLIDTSFDETHPAFAGRTRFVARDFRPSRKSPKNDWHGTAVLSVLAASLDSAAPGLVPAADFYLASTFGADKDGQAVADAMSVLQALAWFDETRVDIVNMSFSGPRNDQIEGTIAAMAAKGVVFVAAAGNRGPGGAASYPAAYPEVIAVTAINKDKRSYRHANQGDYVDVAAPGVDIFTALPGGAHGYRTGTSFATPFVTGLIAAMPEARRDASSKTDVLSRITLADLGEPGRDPVYGSGLPVAPQSCSEVGGVASLPWTQEAQRLASRKSPREPVFVPASVGTFMSFSP